MKKITKIEAAGKRENRKLRVAAYARVSTGSDEQLMSLEAQKEHYEEYIRANSKWEYAGLYYDEGISGTKMARREGLLRMLADCEAGKIDYIIVKSISRFSRNTLESVETVRKLCGMGIYIYFEKENIDTGKMEGELLLSILSSLAENESRSTSQNVVWGIQKRFVEGTFKLSSVPYGYILKDGELFINEPEAEIIRWIFDGVLSGSSTTKLATALTKKGVPPARGKKWYASTIRQMIRNEKYVGDVLLQKTYTDDSFNRHMNNGERNRYLIADHHDPIVSREVFEAANAVIDANAAEKNIVKGTRVYSRRYILSGRIICGECGGKWKRRIINGAPHYVCGKHIDDKEACGQLAIRAVSLEAAFTTMMNKLTFARKEILLPLQGSLTLSGDEDTLERIIRLDEELSGITERKQRVNSFYSKGLLDAAVYAEETDSILKRERELTAERESLTRDTEGGTARKKALASLLKYTQKGIMQTEYNEELLGEHVERVIIYSRTEAGFVMKCGPEFRERME